MRPWWNYKINDEEIDKVTEEKVLGVRIQENVYSTLHKLTGTSYVQTIHKH